MLHPINSYGFDTSHYNNTSNKNMQLGLNTKNRSNTNSNVSDSNYGNKNISLLEAVDKAAVQKQTISDTNTSDTSLANNKTVSNSPKIPHLTFAQQRDSGFIEFEREMSTYFSKIHRTGLQPDPDELKAHFDRGFEIYKEAAIEAGLTDGNSEDYDTFIMEGILVTLRAVSLNSAVAAQNHDGQEITGKPRYEPESGTNFLYFNAKFWFSEREVFESILNTGKEFALEHNLQDPSLSESLHNSHFYMIDSLKVLTKDFDLPEGFVPPSRDFYILRDTRKSYIEISGERIDMAEIWNMTSQKEFEDYLENKGISFQFFQMAAKIFKGDNRLFLDDNIQKMYDKLVNAVTSKQAKLKEESMLATYVTFAKNELKTTDFLA